MLFRAMDKSKRTGVMAFSEDLGSLVYILRDGHCFKGNKTNGSSV